MSQDNDTEYAHYIKRVFEIQQNLSERISNLTDPIEAIRLVVENEGVNLKAIWESDSGYPFDSGVFAIILLPIFVGVVGFSIASFWEPKMHGKELYDEYGNRIVEYPRLPIANLQQSAKDVSAVRENRNSLSWLCHRWLISTNDVIQELQSPLPLDNEDSPTNWGPLEYILQLYNGIVDGLQKSKMLSRTNVVNDKIAIAVNPTTEKTEEQEWHEIKAHLKGVPIEDASYLLPSVLRARRLWKKFQAWIPENEARGFIATFRGEDVMDSYWSSSETFTSDSGRHWKSCKSNLANWAQTKRLNLGWVRERRRRRRVKEEEERRLAELRGSNIEISRDSNEQHEFEGLPTTVGKPGMYSKSLVKKLGGQAKLLAQAAKNAKKK